MTVRLDWPAEAVDRLTEEARRKGLTLDEYILQTVLNRRAANHSGAPEEGTESNARQKAGRKIRELRKGTILGPDLTIRGLIEEGRRF